MMIFLPFLAYIGLLLYLLQLSRSQDWRRSFLRAVVLWGMYMVFVTEALSLFHAVTPIGLAVAWLLPVLVCAIQLWRLFAANGKLELPHLKLQQGIPNRILLFLVLLIVLTTGFIAYLSPVTTTDSLTYHMSRVAHWAQEGSIHHYATGIPRQNYMSPGAEMGILQFYVMLGGDRLANLVQWFAMIASLVGVSLIAKQLGANVTGQVAAVVFAATLPQGIAQASSTMNDYVVTFWMVSVASESLELYQRKSRRASGDFFFVAVSAGMAYLTKPTALAYLLPFAMLLGFSLLREKRWTRIVPILLFVVFLFTLVNAGYMVRNILTYQNILGPGSKVSAFPMFLNRSSYDVTGFLYWKGFISTVLRNAYLHAGTPLPRVNQNLYRLMRAVHVKLGLGLNNPLTTAHRTYGPIRPTTAEARAGNFYQGLLMIVTFLLLAIFWKRFKGGSVHIYNLTVTTAFLVFSYVMLFSAFASRYQLPFFVLYAPIVGYVMSKISPRGVSFLICTGLVVASWSWVVGIQSRPLIPQDEGSSSLLTRSRDDFTTWFDSKDKLHALLGVIQENQCWQMGLIMPGTSKEYLIWSGLGAPREDLRIEWLGYTSASERYADKGFLPCAVICKSCPESWRDVLGLSIAYDDPPFRLFLQVDEQVDPRW